MRYIKVSKEVWRDKSTQVLETNYIGGHVDTRWVNGKPELLEPNIIEWFVHTALQRHFSFGQPYCVVCGKKAMTPNTPDV